MSNYEYANGTGLSVLSQQIFEHLTPLVESVKVFFLASYDRENPPKIGKCIENEDGNSIWATEDNAIFAMEPWSDTPPERLPGMYLWTYTEAIFKDGSIYNSDPVCLVTWDDIDNAVNGMTASLETGLALKADKATTYTKTEVDNFVDTGTVTSEAENPLVIETDAAQYAKKTHLTLEPVQDLHGYDHPWAGGAGKNKADAETLFADYANGDGTYTGGQGITGITSVQIPLGAYIGQTVTYSFTVSARTGETNVWYLRGTINGVSNAGNDHNRILSSESAPKRIYETFTPETVNDFVGISYGSGTGTLTIKDIQLEVGNSMTDYAPYSNICPITPMGHRNLLQVTAQSQTVNGITYTVNSDGSVIANGTATANAILFLNASFEITDNKRYILNGISGGSDSSYRMEVYWRKQNDVFVSSKNLYNGDLELGISDFSGAEKISTLIIVVMSGATVTNVLFKPMLRPASDPDSTFVPYGMARVGAKVTGFNIWDEKWEKGYINVVTGVAVAANDAMRSSFFQVNPGTTYHIKSPYVTASQKVRIYFYDCNKTFIFQYDLPYFNDYTDQGNGNFTVVPNACYMRFTFANLTTPVTYNHDICINVSNAEKNGTYEPYTESVSSLDLPEEIYSGTLDLETGELVADMGMAKIGDFSWSTQQSTYGKFVCVGIPSNIKKDVNALVAICDAYKGYPDALKPPNVNGIYVSYAGQFKVYDSRYDLSQVNDWATEMADTKIVYLLEAPITYQLTPQQLALFKGINNISTNAKTVQVTYRNGELATTGDIVSSTEVAKRNAIGESASYTDARLATELAPILGNLATAETSPASASHAVGEYLLYNKHLYKVLAAISAGQQLTIGTNVGQTNVAAELASQASMLSVLNSNKFELGTKTTLIPNNSDINSYITPGSYHVPSDASAGTMQNLPRSASGKLIVMTNGANAVYVSQFYYPSTASHLEYARNYSNGTWEAWKLNPTREEFNVSTIQRKSISVSSSSTQTINDHGFLSAYGVIFLVMRYDSASDGASCYIVRHSSAGYQVSEIYKGSAEQTAIVDENGVIKNASSQAENIQCAYFLISSWS